MSTRPAVQRSAAPKDSAAALPPLAAATAASGSKSRSVSRGKHKSFHACGCYGHGTALPDYKLLTMPRTNNYYAAIGGCPCIPRAAANPGSWGLRKAQMRSSTYRSGHGCTNKHPEVRNSCSLHSGHQYGWRPGPHTVKGKNTAATGKCDTFGNLAFKSQSRAYLPIEDDVSDLSSVSAQKLEDLEALILEEHAARVRAEADVEELEAIQASGQQDSIKREKQQANRQRAMTQASEEQLSELLREVRGIVDRPLHQTNMAILRRILARQEMLQRNREYLASKAALTENSE